MRALRFRQRHDTARAQHLACLQEPRNDGCDGHVEQCHDLRVGQAFDRDQHDDFALLERQRNELCEKPLAVIGARRRQVAVRVSVSALSGGPCELVGVHGAQQRNQLYGSGRPQRSLVPNLAGTRERLLDQIIRAIGIVRQKARVAAKPRQGCQQSSAENGMGGRALVAIQRATRSLYRR